MSDQQQDPTSENWPSIAQFYAGKDVFITGATGFMGKCLMEKLLRSCPAVGRIMILIRPKKGKTVRDRVEGILSSKLFDIVRQDRPEALEKVIPIAGDIMEQGFGIGESDLKLLLDNVGVVIHLAATIKFDAPLRESLTMNVIGVKELLKLCRRMKKLASVVHVSTAFAHCNKETSENIDEIIYPPKIHPDKVLALLDWMTDEQLETITPTLLEGRPNTYTYTKSLAEYVISNEARGLPLAICRPSIVSASLREPFPGWVDCLHGPTGIIVGVGKGIVRVMKCVAESRCDMVPVDLVNNYLISVSWITGVNPKPQPIIYHLTSGTTNPLRWIDLYPLVVNNYTKNPFEEVFSQPCVFRCRPQSAWMFYHFFLHLLPGFFADLLLRLQGKKPRIVRLYHKVGNVLEQLSYFTTKYWNWSHTNMDKLLQILSPEDKQVFDFDVRKLDWEKYVHDYALGTKRHLFNEDLANIPMARRQIRRLKNIQYTFNLIMFLIATRLVYLRSKIAREIWSGMWNLCVQVVTRLGIPFLHWSS